MSKPTQVYAAQPWYREPWPWILMTGPAAVVVAGFVTAYLAVTHNDALVVDNYYKEGLAINRVLERDEAAQKAGYRAQVMFSEDGGACACIWRRTVPLPRVGRKRRADRLAAA
jgi:hypothetical protein